MRLSPSSPMMWLERRGRLTILCVCVGQTPAPVQVQDHAAPSYVGQPGPADRAHLSYGRDLVWVSGVAGRTRTGTPSPPSLHLSESISRFTVTYHKRKRRTAVAPSETLSTYLLRVAKCVLYVLSLDVGTFKSPLCVPIDAMQGPLPGASVKQATRCPQEVSACQHMQLFFLL